MVVGRATLQFVLSWSGDGRAALRSSCLDPCDCGLSVMVRESLLELRVSSEGAAASQLFRVAFTKLGALP